MAVIVTVAGCVCACVFFSCVIRFRLMTVIIPGMFFFMSVVMTFMLMIMLIFMGMIASLVLVIVMSMVIMSVVIFLMSRIFYGSAMIMTVVSLGVNQLDPWLTSTAFTSESLFSPFRNPGTQPSSPAPLYRNSCALDVFRMS